MERTSALDIMLSSSSPNSSSSFFDGPSLPPPKMPPATSYAARSRHAQQFRRGQRCADRARAPLSSLTEMSAGSLYVMHYCSVLQDLTNLCTAGVLHSHSATISGTIPASSLPPPVAVAAGGVLSSLFAGRPVCRKLFPAAYACPKRSARRAGNTIMKLAWHCSACSISLCPGIVPPA